MWLFKKKEYNISENEMKELEKVRKNFEKNMMSEIAKIKGEMKANLMKEIEKTNLDCKGKLKIQYMRTGQFPKNFECLFLDSDGYYHFDNYNKFKMEDIYKEIQKTSPHNITFEWNKTLNRYEVHLNNII